MRISSCIESSVNNMSDRLASSMNDIGHCRLMADLPNMVVQVRATDQEITPRYEFRQQKSTKDSGEITCTFIV